MTSTEGSRPTVRIEASNARLHIVAEPRTAVAVDGTARVAPGSSDVTTIDRIRSRLTVRVPVGADVLIGASSGRVDVDGPAGHVAVVTESGRVHVEDARSVDVRTSSASVKVGRVHDTCRVHTASGRVEVGGCRSADVSTKSGKVEVGGLAGPARVHCVSGRIDLALVAPGDVDAESVSGRITVTYPDGVRVFRADHNEDRLLRPPDTDCTLAVRSVSGKIEVAAR